MEHTNIVIIGAGIIGLACGYELARTYRQTYGENAAGNIIILEKEELTGSGSTAACSGGIRLQFSNEANIRFSRYGLQYYEKMHREVIVSAEDEQGIGLVRSGYLFLRPKEENGAATDKQDKQWKGEQHERDMDLQRSLGVNVQWKDTDWIREKAHFLDLADIAGGSYSPHEAHADPGLITHVYLKRCREMGVTVRTNCEVTGFTISEGRVTEVATPEGPISADTVINCAGPFANTVFSMAGLDFPLTPRRRHVLVVRPDHPNGEETPLIVDTTTGWYFKPEPGNIALMGGTDRDGTVSLEPLREEKTVDKIVEAGLRRAPTLETADIVRTIVGVRCMSPDDLALLGPVPLSNEHNFPHTNLFCAVGFSGHGFMHAPAVSRSVAELILDGECTSFDIAPFQPARFSDYQKFVSPESYVF